MDKARYSKQMEGQTDRKKDRFRLSLTENHGIKWWPSDT